ncbi:winged helix-turn-helix domain-containing protein [Ornithinimicrobium ciconiae]|uniref:Winged helix-turn-helix domain-containing protein n=1 Tax=Ornithinimicrobium ciconiae TaxID=2594265 RepID=A0A516GCI2_9MICO|nr:crosslink repair DNA glycosylase YcaQ family protein [Ornithinimicrobium ciconiae]QDO89229.1 winged helix-turn-helix domain-containing protein [Ornithinimicrobium ciconiae]
MTELTLPQARRIALAAQGFADPRPARPTMRHIQRVIDRVQVVQIDSVNVLARSHYLPFFSRLGPYDTALLDRARDGSGPRSREPRRLVESWAHVASLIPPDTWPFLGFRMARAEVDSWSHQVASEHPGVLEAVREVVRDHGPLTAREVDTLVETAEVRARDNWGWNWSLVKECLEHLFWAGQIVSSGRNSQFERRYAVPSFVLPPEVLARAPGQPAAPDAEESGVELMRRAVRAHGIGTAADLRDYFRLRQSMAGPALAELVRLGEVEQVSVRGWDRPAYLDTSARRPRSVAARSLLSPFDSLVWERDRTERLFGFHYRIEIYVPEPKRVFGYYVLPFLLGEELVARVDLKADRARGRLLVRRLHCEPGAPAHTREALGEELGLMAGWLGLDRVDFI